MVVVDTVIMAAEAVAEEVITVVAEEAIMEVVMY